MTFYAFFGLIFIGLFPFLAAAQDSTYQHTSFEKGMWISGLSGSIQSGSTTDKNSNTLISNQFTFQSQSAYFFANRLAIGWNISGSGVNNNDGQHQENSIFALGPYSRYYLHQNPYGGMFAELGAQYVTLSDRRTSLGSSISLNEISRLRGFGFITGIGYTYLLHKGIGFDIRMMYQGAWMRGDRTNLDNEERENLKAYVGQILFQFGFTIFINEFFF
ncbi:hypothetical protein [Algivirga pacifica]|uniref:Outer membrane protein beta-barrel domain-containing protein n=1 Tax=Algivirga pacifica TaxID=1162670 RepID=A0ABP9DBR3_9BACT